jgi:fructose-1-phosphate kinase PfkB-like protein
MTTNTKTAKTNQVDAGYESSKFALGVGIAMAALIGLWGTLCLVSALAGNGPVNLVKNYFNALLG